MADLDRFTHLCPFALHCFHSKLDGEFFPALYLAPGGALVIVESVGFDKKLWDSQTQRTENPSSPRPLLFTRTAPVHAPQFLWDSIMITPNIFKLNPLKNE